MEHRLHTPKQTTTLEATMEALFRPGQMTPVFTLNDSQGNEVRRVSFRPKINLVLIFGPDIDSLKAYLQPVADQVQRLKDENAQVLVITRQTQQELADAGVATSYPFPILADPDGKASAKYLPEGATAGLFVTDRFGEAYLVAPKASVDQLDDIEEIHEWLLAIDRQCSI
jgi:peroxiredoxin